jgi:hypothetical protein
MRNLSKAVFLDALKTHPVAPTMMIPDPDIPSQGRVRITATFSVLQLGHSAPPFSLSEEFVLVIIGV